jgi:hypothetical protein
MNPPLLDDEEDDETIYYPARGYLNDPSIKNRKITYQPTAPIQVISKIPDPIEPAQFSLPHPPARLSVPSKVSIKTCHVHSTPDLLDMHSHSTACAVQHQISASTRHQAIFPPRVKQRLASVRCIQPSPAQAKVKKRSFDAIKPDEPSRFIKVPILLLPLTVLYSLRFLVTESSIYVQPCSPSSTPANLWSHTYDSSIITLPLMDATRHVMVVPPANHGNPHANLGRTSAKQLQSNPLIIPHNSCNHQIVRWLHAHCPYHSTLLYVTFGSVVLMSTAHLVPLFSSLAPYCG